MAAGKPYILNTVKSGRNPRIPACRMLANEGRLSMNEILKLDNVEKYYGNKANLTKAVDKISFSVEKESLSELWEPAAPARQHS